MDDTFEERLAAVERALTDGEHDCSALAEGAVAADRVARLESDVAELTDRVAELEAATQALRGYVGNVRAVNNDVEQRADLALSKAEAARRAVGRTSSDGNEQAETTTETTTEHEPGTRRCDRCERPFDGGSPLGGERGEPEPRLEALRDGNAVAAGAQADGTDESSQDSGVFTRVRALL
jgi:chromosome segregation ATPase